MTWVNWATRHQMNCPQPLLPISASRRGEKLLMLRAKSNRTPMPQPDAEMIVLIHGFGGKRLAMQPLRYRLRRQGFRITTWSYPSLLNSIGHHAAKLHEHLTEELSHERRIHIVAHSMGSIVARSAIAAGPIANLGRTVLLAPPNRGTPIARYAAKIAGNLCRPIAELSDDALSVANMLPSIGNLEIGIVAAKFDVLVPVDNTHLAGESEHAVLNATHNSLLLSKTAALLTGSFIADGRFS